MLYFIGAGIYVLLSNGSDSYDMQGPQPFNSYALVNTRTGLSSYRIHMYCCSNNTNQSASFTYPDGHVSSDSYWGYDVIRYSGSDPFAGCYAFYRNNYYYYYYYFGYDGIYTCNIDDSRGNTLHLNFGLYDEGFSSE